VRASKKKRENDPVYLKGEVGGEKSGAGETTDKTLPA